MYSLLRSMGELPIIMWILLFSELWLESFAQCLFKLVFAGCLPTDFDIQVYSGWSSETKTVSEFLEVKLVDIENLSLFV